MRVEEITVETIDIEPPGRHPDLSTYETVVFRVLPSDHPNSFTVPISVNLDQFPASEAQAQARRIFHGLMSALAKATSAWDAATSGAETLPPATASATDARLGPAGDPAEGKR
jgi:hypothetical protein